MGQKKDTNVLLTVDTSNIIEANKNSCVVFTDDRGDGAETPGHPENYISTVDKDKYISWSGVASDASTGDVINITQVSKKSVNGGSDILKNDTNTPKSGENFIKAKVKDKNVVGYESYNITFNINGDNNKTFTIDPKLQMSKQ